MSARTLCSLLLLAGLSLSFVLIASRHPEDADEPSTEVERIDSPLDSGRAACGGVYECLAGGGQMYAGTVLSVMVQGSDRGPADPPSEWGLFRFRVARVVVGPNVRELTLGYWWMDETMPQIGPDWLCNDGPWRERPRVGQQLLLLEDAAKYIAAKETKTQDKLFQKLCQSSFSSHRDFAYSAAFFPIDPKAPESVYGGITTRCGSRSWCCNTSDSPSPR